MDKKLVEFTVFGQKLYLNGENGDISDDKEFLLTHGINNPDFYQLLNDFCVQKLLRNKKDPELAKFMKDNPELKFSQAKKIFDAKVKRY